MAIEKTTPIVTTNTFNTWWISNVSYNKLGKTPILLVKFLPYNGQYVISTNSKDLMIDVNKLKSTDSTFSTIIDNLETEVKRQYILKNTVKSTKDLIVKAINVFAEDPQVPVRTTVIFNDNGVQKVLVLSDIYKLASTDSTFAYLINSVLMEFGRQGKLQKSID